MYLAVLPVHEAEEVVEFVLPLVDCEDVERAFAVEDAFVGVSAVAVCAEKQRGSNVEEIHRKGDAGFFVREHEAVDEPGARYVTEVFDLVTVLLDEFLYDARDHLRLPMIGLRLARVPRLAVYMMYGHAAV